MCLRFKFRMTAICFLVAVVCIGNIKLSDARGQAPELPHGFPNYPGGIQVRYPGQHGGFAGGSQSGFPGMPGGFATNPQNAEALEKLKRQCISNGGQRAFDELQQAGNNMQMCIGNVLPNIGTISDKSEGGICHFMHSTIRKCMTEFTSKLEHCMDKATAYAPQLSVEMFDSIFKFLCSENAKHIITLITSMNRPSACIMDMKESTISCFSNTKKLQIESFTAGAGVTYNMNRTELCSDIRVLRDCVNKHAYEYCTGEQYDLVTGISNAVYEPCSACKLFITNTFLLFVFLFLTKML